MNTDTLRRLLDTLNTTAADLDGPDDYHGGLAAGLRLAVSIIRQTEGREQP